MHEDDWAITAAVEAIEKLLVLEEGELSKLEPGDDIERESESCELQSIQEECLSSMEDSIVSEECIGGGDAASTGTTADVSNMPEIVT